jgi:hypothetical protein
VSELEDILREAQRRHIILQERPRFVALWSAGQRVPRHLRQQIREHNREILMMLARSEEVTCPSPELHAQYHGAFRSRRYCCDACARLRGEIERVG